jgi:hypothetical protein
VISALIGSRMPPELPEPWRSFLQELDEHLENSVVLHCLGGFVVTTCYGLPRTTADIDVLVVAPSRAIADAVAIAGELPFFIDDMVCTSIS